MWRKNDENDAFLCGLVFRPHLTDRRRSESEFMKTRTKDRNKRLQSSSRLVDTFYRQWGYDLIVFLGLDASSSLELLNHLNLVAESGRLVILTIHQPRLEIFHLFHKILFLCDGQVIK